MINKKEVDFLSDKFFKRRSYLSIGKGKIASMFDVDEGSVLIAKDIVNKRIEELITPGNDGKRNVLFIGDLHAPFMHEQAVPFIRWALSTHKITDVVFAGDIQDNHFSSFHDADPDGLSENEEFNRAKHQISELYDLIPSALVCSGNHDVIPNRKAFNAGLSTRWIRTIADVLEVPGWNFQDYHRIGDFVFTHGLGQQSISRARNLNLSVAQGHLHSKFDSQSFYDAGSGKMIYAINGGCLIDSEAYAFNYGKFGPVMLKGLTIIEDIENTPSVKQITLDEFINIQ